MKVPPKRQWRVAASSGDPERAVDDSYATAWTAEAADRPWFEIDLGAVATLGGLEVYWGERAPVKYRFASSLDGEAWSEFCRTRHGEGGQDVFAFPPVEARFVRWTSEDSPAERGPEIVEINLYAPEDAASVREAGRLAALGHGAVKVPAGESITVDFGAVRSPLGALIEWGEAHGTVFSTHLSDDGETFREMGRIETGDGGTDSFWWRSTTSRYFRLTVHEASAPDGAVVDELKLRILNKDRMPIGQLERAAQAARGDLYPQSLLGRQVYWTALGEFDQGEQALLDEYGDLEPRRGSPQITPLVRLDGALHGAPGCASVHHELAEGSLPIASVVWSVQDLELRTTALADAGQAVAEHRLTNRSGAVRQGALVLAVRPVQINPYWQHGGHAPISAIAVRGDGVWVNERIYAAFSRQPDAAAVADFDGGDVVEADRRRAARNRPQPPLGLGPRQRRLRIRVLASTRRKHVGRCFARRCATTSLRAPTSRSTRCATAFAAPGGKSSARAGSSSATAKSATRSRRRSRYILVERHPLRLQAGPAQLRPHLDPRRLLAGARPSVGRPDRRGQALRPLVRRARLQERPGSANPQRRRRGQPGLWQRHRIRRAGRVRRNRRRGLSRRQGSRVSRGRFRTGRPRDAVHRDAVRANRCAARAGEPLPRPRSRRRSATRATASRPTATGTTISP